MREALRPAVRHARGGDRRPGARSPSTWKDEPTLGLHPLPAGPAHHRRQAGHACGATTSSSTCTSSSTAATSCRSAGRRARPARRRASSPCSAATTRRCGSSTALVADEDGLRRRLPGHRADLLAQDRQPGPRRPGRARPVGAQVGHRPAAAGPPAGDRRAVRGRAGRLVGDGVQAEPDAGRADVRRWRGS